MDEDITKGKCLICNKDIDKTKDYIAVTKNIEHMDKKGKYITVSDSLSIFDVCSEECYEKTRTSLDEQKREIKEETWFGRNMDEIYKWAFIIIFAFLLIYGIITFWILK